MKVTIEHEGRSATVELTDKSKVCTCRDAVEFCILAMMGVGFYPDTIHSHLKDRAGEGLF